MSENSEFFLEANYVNRKVGTPFHDHLNFRNAFHLLPYYVLGAIPLVRFGKSSALPSAANKYNK